jgi:succinoglycan biosynthesis protein ExoM
MGMGRMQGELIVIGVPTCRRPKMLARCLASLATQIADGFRIRIVVASNGHGGEESKTVVQKFATWSPFSTTFLHDPVQSIARARNAVLDHVEKVGAGWIAFIDDDAVADPEWLANLMAPQYRDTPVLMGANVYIYPSPRPFWITSDDEVKGEEGQRCKTAYTGNVRFSYALVRHGLRFDEKLGLMGGEDNEFFAAAHKAGFEIRRTLKAITREAAHPERLTYRALVYRSYWCAASEFRRLVVTRGRAGAALRKAHTIPLNLIFGAAWLVGAGAVSAVSRNAFKRMAIEGGLKLAKGAGRAVALIGIKPQPYRVIHGE